MKLFFLELRLLGVVDKPFLTLLNSKAFFWLLVGVSLC